MRRFTDKGVVITGAGRGIGAALAKAFSLEGARVFLCARTDEEVRQVADSIVAEGGRAGWTAIDVSEPDGARALALMASSELGRVDVLVNNAGILGPKAPLLEVSPGQWGDTLRVNTTGPFLVTRAFLPTMMQAGAGVIVNVTSTLGRKARAGWGAYTVSKFAVEGLTQTLAEEVGPHGLAAVAINPGATRTRMRAAAEPDEDPSTLPAPEMVAEGFLRILARPSGEINGKSFDVRETITDLWQPKRPS